MIVHIMDLQRKFDAKVLEEKGLTNPHVQERVLALLVELGEMSNEWRRFKFWSEDREPRKEKLLEEYVDGVHFVFSVGNALHVNLSQIFTPTGNYGVEDDYQSVRNQICALYAMISQYAVRMELPLYSWEAIISEYLHLGTKLGFTLGEIHEAYMRKHETNHQRLETGY